MLREHKNQKKTVILCRCNKKVFKQKDMMEGIR